MNDTPNLLLSMACYIVSFVAGILIWGCGLVLLGGVVFLLADSRRVKQAALFAMIGALSGIGLTLLLLPPLGVHR